MHDTAKKYEALQQAKDRKEMDTLIESLHKEVETIIQQKLPAPVPGSETLHAEISWNLSTMYHTWDWTKHRITSGLENQLIQFLEMKVCKKSEAQFHLLVGEQLNGCFIIGKTKRYWLKPIKSSSTSNK